VTDWTETEDAPASWTMTLDGSVVWGEGAPVDPATLFGPDFVAIRDRLATLGYFVTITDVLNAANAIEESEGVPPAAFVSTAAETGQPNKLVGGHAQRVAVRLSILFVVGTERAAHDTKDVTEQLRKAIIRLFMGWVAPGTDSPMNYDRYLPRAMGEGLFWGEVLFTTSYRLSKR
jgi:hypothetical protein